MQKGSSSFSFFDWQFLIKLLLTTIYYFMFLFRIRFRISHRLVWKNFHQHGLVSIENFSSWRIKAWSCQWVVNQHWRVCEPKVKKFRKVKDLVRVHFQRKWRVEQKQKVQKRKELWQLQVSNIEKREVIVWKVQKRNFENFWGMLLGSKTKV